MACSGCLRAVRNPETAGLGLLRGKCERFPESVKSPHVGWNTLTIDASSRLFRGIPSPSFVYFTHSFRAPVNEATVACCEYGGKFSAAVERDQIVRSAVPSGKIGRGWVEDCWEIFARSDMLTKRIIACLDVDGGRVVKGVQFENLRDAGDPAELAKAHSASGADEIVLLDISAAHERRATLLDTVRETARQLFIPFTVGGGIRTLEDAAAVFAAGADKISINSAALADPDLITRIAERFGSQAVVVAIDAKRGKDGADWEAFTHGGRICAVVETPVSGRWKRKIAGAGEILLTSMDRDGTGSGLIAN